MVSWVECEQSLCDLNCRFIGFIFILTEKEELVNLVLIHVDNPTAFSPDSQPSQAYTMGTDQSDDARSNPFDHIRSTCQNLFTTFTDRISTGRRLKHNNASYWITQQSLSFALINGLNEKLIYFLVIGCIVHRFQFRFQIECYQC